MSPAFTMLHFIKIVLCLCLSTKLCGQPLTGRVRDSATGIAVSYASIGLIRSNKGTSAGQDGRFTLNAPHNSMADSLLISSVGYKTVKVPLENGKLSYEVRLAKREPTMKEVIIRRYFRKITLPWNRIKSDFTLSTIGLNTQVARLLRAPESFTRLESVSVATRSSRLFGLGKSARFRIRIYDYDTVFNKPGTELCDSVVEVSGRGIVTVKLDKYQIILPQQHFFVAVQWLFIDENREDMKDNGNMLPYYIHNPGVRMTHVTEGGCSTWLQYHNGQWNKTHDEAAITATIFY
jgi:hypothetical protein